MDADRWRRVEEVLDVALTRDPAERAAVLDASCSGDWELRREVEPLLLQAYAVVQKQARAQALLARRSALALDQLYRALGRPAEGRKYATPARPDRGGR